MPCECGPAGAPARAAWESARGGRGRFRGSCGPAASPRVPAPGTVRLPPAPAGRARTRHRDLSVPLLPVFLSPEEVQGSPDPLGTGRRGASGRAPRRAGGRRARGPLRRRGAGDEARGEGGGGALAQASRDPRPPPCLPSAAWARPLGSGLSGHRDQPGRALGPGSPAGSRPCAPPPPPPPPPCPRPRPEPPACGAEQTRLSGRPGREGGQRKEIASPRQGILNYRLKANKTYTTFSLCQPTAATKGNAKR